jgi:hypothetical protein
MISNERLPSDVWPILGAYWYYQNTRLSATIKQ